WGPPHRVGKEKARYLIDYAHKEAQATKFKIAVFGGILQYESRALQDFEKSKECCRRLLEIEQEERKEQAKGEREQMIDSEVTAYLNSLSDEAASELDTHALTEISDAERARFHEAKPSFQGLLMKGIRRRHVRNLLDL